MSKINKTRFEDEKFTLFPFLDALSGVVGVLALVISSLSILANDKPRLIFDMPVDKTEKQPHYVECIEGAVILHPEKTVVTPKDIEAESGAWLRFLDGINENQENEYAVLLIRQSGFDAYNAAIVSLQSHGIDVGREIVSIEGEIEIQSEK